MSALIIAIATIILGLIGVLIKLALDDRDKRIKALEDQNSNQEVRLTGMHAAISVLQHQATDQLYAVRRLEGKLDQLKD